jgi:Transglycosylase SLT domain
MKSGALAILVMFSLVSAAVCARAAESRQPFDASGVVNRPKHQSARPVKSPRPDVPTPLDRVAQAVDGAESSHGENPAMWRPEPTGPQGPMQVTEAAATDVGGGDRFDTVQNRALGRAYLAQLYRRYKNWPDTIAAYNWGVGKLDAWVKAGRPPDRFLTGVASYTRRVLQDSGLCDGSAAAPARRASPKTASRSQSGQQTLAAEEVSGDTFEQAVCRDLANWAAAANGDNRDSFAYTPSRFHAKLEEALRLAVEHPPAAQHLARGGDDLVAASWYGSAAGASPLRQRIHSE